MFQILRPDGTIRDKAVFKNLDLSAEEKIKLYRMMAAIRIYCIRAEDEAQPFKDRMTLFIGPLGEEAVAASVLALFPKDKKYTYGRYHDIHPMCGGQISTVLDIFYENLNADPLADLLAKKVSPFYVSVGSHVPHAVGDALAGKLSGKSYVTVPYFGDGAMSRTDVHSALNFAAVFGAPTIFVCRNNAFAISETNELQKKTKTFVERAEGYGIKSMLVDGNDPFAVYEATKRARKHCLEQGAPFFIETVGYRLGPHTTKVYQIRPRPQEEIERAILNDCLRRFRAYLMSREAKEEEGIEWTDDSDKELYFSLGGKLLFSLSPARKHLLGFDWLREESGRKFYEGMGSPVGEIIEASKKSFEGATQSLERAQELVGHFVEGHRTPRTGELYKNIPQTDFNPETLAEAEPRDAIGLALYDSISFDKSVVLIGEDVGDIGGVMRTTALDKSHVEKMLPEFKERILVGYLPIKEKFPRNVFDTPLDESGIVAIGLGLALAGMRPGMEFQFDGFNGIAYHQIEEFLRMPQRLDWRVPVPGVLRFPCGVNKAIEYHQTTSIPRFMNLPGVIMAIPSTVQDFYDMLRAAFASDKLVLVFEHLGLLKTLRENLIRRNPWQPIEAFGTRKVKEGNDITVTAYGKLVHECVKAVEEAEKERSGISVEILDIRVLPFPEEQLVNSVAKTGRLVCVAEEPVFGGTAAELASEVFANETSFGSLRSPLIRLGSPGAYQLHSRIYKYYSPTAEQIKQAILKSVDFK